MPFTRRSLGCGGAPLRLALRNAVVISQQTFRRCQVLTGGQWPAYNFTHFKTAGFTMPDIPHARLSQAERDAEAKRLFAESGVGDLTLELIYNTTESHRQIATVVSQMWKQKLGVKTELANLEWKTYLGIRRNQEFDVARLGWCGDYNEASTFLDLLTTTQARTTGGTRTSGWTS